MSGEIFYDVKMKSKKKGDGVIQTNDEESQRSQRVTRDHRRVTTKERQETLHTDESDSLVKSPRRSRRDFHAKNKKKPNHGVLTSPTHFLRSRPASTDSNEHPDHLLFDSSLLREKGYLPLRTKAVSGTSSSKKRKKKRRRRKSRLMSHEEKESRKKRHESGYEDRREMDSNFAVKKRHSKVPRKRRHHRLAKATSATSEVEVSLGGVAEVADDSLTDLNIPSLGEFPERYTVREPKKARASHQGFIQIPGTKLRISKDTFEYICWMILVLYIGVVLYYRHSLQPLTFLRKQYSSTA